MGKYFPLFISLENKNILIVGAGNIAMRRLETLLSFVNVKDSGNIAVVAPNFLKSGKPLLDRVVYLERCFEEADLKGRDIVLISTNDAEENRRIAKLCEERGILKNVSTDQSLCDFFFPSTVELDDIVIGINSGGKNPAATKATRIRIEECLKNSTE